MGELYSIGVDIGTSTTKVVISRFVLQQQMGANGIPQARITGKEIIYAGSPSPTPLLDECRVNFPRIRRLVGDSLLNCPVSRSKISTGAVIITGESARTLNARQVTKQLSQFLGDFIVETAGPELEALLAAQGAGAMAFSQSRQTSVLNLDIGGGTTNGAYCVNGQSRGLFAMDIGGRLVRLEPNWRVSYLSPRIQFLVDLLELPLREGATASPESICRLCGVLADYLLEAANGRFSAPANRLLITPMPAMAAPPEYLSFSGGVSEYMGKTKALEYPLLHGDMGILLADEIHRRLVARKRKVWQSGEKIRATVIGAGHHTLALSGSTVYQNSPGMILRNLPIIRLEYQGQSPQQTVETLAQEYRLYAPDGVAVYVTLPESVRYREMKELADGLLAFYAKVPGPVVVLLGRDLAKALGQVMNRRAGGKKSICCLDEVCAEAGNYIDIGSPLEGCIPVVVKTLVYNR